MPVITDDTSWNQKALVEVLAQTSRPILLAGGRILSEDPVIGVMADADVLLGSTKIVGVGPGLVTAAGDDGAIVVDCTGCTIVPAVVDLVNTVDGRESRAARQGSIAPGREADLLVVPTGSGTTIAGAVFMVLENPHTALALFASGTPQIWDGKDVAERTYRSDDAAKVPAVDATRLGTWVDTTGFLHQELTVDGRYDETRGGRPHAFQGNYWIDGDRIEYLDDLGFWAYGEFLGPVLHHAGYEMRLTADD